MTKWALKVSVPLRGIFSSNEGNLIHDYFDFEKFPSPYGESFLLTDDKDGVGKGNNRFRPLTGNLFF